MGILTKARSFQFYFLLFLLTFPTLSFSQEDKTIFYGKDSFLLEGTRIEDSLKENRYDRLPLSYKEKVREPLWALSKNAAGMSIRFKTNSRFIRVKWSLLHNTTMNHMPETGIKGIDLYFKNKDTWQYINTAKPHGFNNEYTLVDNMPPAMREFKMYLPLYDGLQQIEVGIDSSAIIEKPQKEIKKPIVFYGTSITQGACASRPGMAHTNIIERNLAIECLNFGFSGNGKMEPSLAEFIADIDALFYVIECLPNMSPKMVTENTRPLVKILREKHPNTPILLVENFYYDDMVLDSKRRASIEEKNEALKNEYDQLIAAGFKNIHLINTHNATGKDHESTVDTVHFTDLGFLRYANYLMEKFHELNLLPKKP